MFCLTNHKNFQEPIGQSLKTQIYYFFISCRTPTVGQNTESMKIMESVDFVGHRYRGQITINKIKQNHYFVLLVVGQHLLDQTQNFQVCYVVGQKLQILFKAVGQLMILLDPAPCTLKLCVCLCVCFIYDDFIL